MDPIFWKLHSGLDHEAPGRRANTLRALDLTDAEGPLAVLDVACGPGAASVALLDALPQARLTGVDHHLPFLTDAKHRCAAAGHAARFRADHADIAALSYAPVSFGLIWCEGAAYIQGVPAALDTWHRLLVPGGRIAFTEAVWLTDDRPARARAMWQEYPAMTDAPGVRDWIAAAGLRFIGDFVLPPAAWANYYDPLEARLDTLTARYGAEAPALAEVREEIAVWRAHGASYGYAFFIAGK